MNRQTEERWRAALNDRGKDRVQAELELRPGAPDELMYGLTDTPPYPSRGFCEAWVRGDATSGFGLSGNTAVMIGFSLLAIACLAGGVGGMVGGGANQARPTFSGGFAPPRQAAGGGGGRPAGAAPDGIGRFLPSKAGLQIGERDGAAPSLQPDCSAVTQSTSSRSVTSARPCKPRPLPSALNAGSPAQNHR